MSAKDLNSLVKHPCKRFLQWVLEDWKAEPTAQRDCWTKLTTEPASEFSSFFKILSHNFTIGKDAVINISWYNYPPPPCNIFRVLNLICSQNWGIYHWRNKIINQRNTCVFDNILVNSFIFWFLAEKLCDVAWDCFVAAILIPCLAQGWRK